MGSRDPGGRGKGQLVAQARERSRLGGRTRALSASPSAEATGAAALKETSKPSGARNVRMID